MMLIPSLMITIGIAFFLLGLWLLSKALVQLIGAYINNEGFTLGNTYVLVAVFMSGAGTSLAFYGALLAIRS